jgi:hypothetical protein
MEVLCLSPVLKEVGVAIMIERCVQIPLVHPKNQHKLIIPIGLVVSDLFVV